MACNVFDGALALGGMEVDLDGVLVDDDSTLLDGCAACLGVVVLDSSGVVLADDDTTPGGSCAARLGVVLFTLKTLAPSQVSLEFPG